MVYFIATEDMKFVKIGFTGKITRDRFNYCKSHCPYDLILLLFINGNEQLEKELHNKFCRSIKKYEWFYLTQDILVFIDENKINHVEFKQNTNATKELIRNIRIDYQSNLSLRDMAIKYQRTKRSIQGIIRRNNIVRADSLS